MRPSLRTTMGALNASVVIVVAAITLAITWTVSIDALRSIGKSHASALGDSVEARVEQFMETPPRIADGLRNYVRRMSTGIDATTNTSVSLSNVRFPSSDAARYDELTHVVSALFLEQSNFEISIHAFFMDGTRISFLPSTGYSDTFIKQNQRVDADDVPQRDYAWYWRANYSVIPPNHPVYVDDWSPPADIRSSGLLDSLNVGSFGGTQASYILPSVVFLSSGATPYYATLAAPLRLSNGTVYGYTLVSRFLTDIDQFLRGLQGTPNTYSFAVDAQKQLVASSHPAPVTSVRTIQRSERVPTGCVEELTSLLSAADPDAVVTPLKNVSCRASASQFPYAPLRAVASGDQGFFFTEARAVRLQKVSGDGHFYVSSARVPIRYAGSIRLQLIVAMPEEDVIGSVVDGRNLAIGVSVAVLVLVVCCSFALITMLLKPLPIIANRMSRAAALDDTDDTEDLSPLEEVRELQYAYYAMNDELRRIRSFVPQSLLQARRHPVTESANHTAAVLRAGGVGSGSNDMDGSSSSHVLTLGGGGYDDQADLFGEGASQPPGSAAGSAALGATRSTVTAEFLPDGAAAPRPRRRVSGGGVSDAAASAYQPSSVPTAPSVVGGGGGQHIGPSGRRRSARKVTFAPSMAPLATETGLRAQVVSVVAVDLAGFHVACRDVTHDRLTQLMQNTVAFVQSTATRHKGVLDSFNGDHFLLTFNAARPCVQHTVRAAQVAHALAVEFVTKPPTPEDAMTEEDLDTPFRLHARIGMASGRAYVGHAGNDTVKSFNVIGSALTHAVSLQRLAKLYRRRGVVVPQRVFVELSKSFHVRPIDIVCLAGGSKPAVIGEIVRRIGDGRGAEQQEPDEAGWVQQQARAVSNNSSSTRSRRSGNRSSSRIDDASAWLFEQHGRSNLDSAATAEWAQRRMQLFLSVAAGHMEAAETHYQALLEELSTRQAFESQGSDFSDATLSSFVFRPALPPPGASGTDSPTPLGPRGTSPHPSIAEAQLAKLELLQFLELSDVAESVFAAPSMYLPGNPNDSSNGSPPPPPPPPPPGSLPLPELATSPPASVDDRAAAAGTTRAATPPPVVTTPSTHAGDPPTLGAGAAGTNATPFTVNMNTPTGIAEDPLPARSVWDVLHVAHSVAPRPTTVVSLMQAARQGLVGHGLGVFYDMVASGVPSHLVDPVTPAAFMKPPPPQAAGVHRGSITWATSTTTYGQSASLINAASHNPAGKPLPATA